MDNPLPDNPLVKVAHHQQEELCSSRPAYRQGRKLTAVKVYTIASESQHLFVYGVPKINLRNELKSLFNKYGQILKIHVVEDHEVEVFTECYHVHYQRIQSARIAKRLVDNKSFYGGILHVCYAPEYETVEETVAKLHQRQKDVLTRLAKASSEYKHPIPPVEPEVSHNLKKRKQPKDDPPPLYEENDPILSLNKKLKNDYAKNIHKYLSQSSDINGGVSNKMKAPKKILKQFIPSTLRNKKCPDAPQNKFIGPQFPDPNT